MVDHGNFPAQRSGGEVALPVDAPNALNLNEQWLREIASDIRQHGISRDELNDIAKRRLTEDNPVLSQFVGDSIDDVRRSGGDYRSFARGATLGLHLIDKALADGAPVMGVVGSVQLASQYRDQLGSLDEQKVAADDLLASQQALSGAFDEAWIGMPEDTDRAMARFGAGIITLGVMAAAQFGGKGREMWVEPNRS
jgi:hypothetical protein